MEKLKVMTVVGTRPEIIRLSRTISLLDQYFDHILVHTGQNYDYELNEIFFKDLELRTPDYFLNIDTSSLGTSVGDIIKKSEEVLIKIKPDALLVLGDTNSCLSAYMAKRLKIPIYHMEAGNRCFDLNVPEEINRKVIDHLADFNLVYTEHARRHLIAEGFPQRRIYLTGSPMFEVLNYYKSKINESKIIEELFLSPFSYFLISIHREENIDNEKNLQELMDTLQLLFDKYKKPLIVSTHPRTKKQLLNTGKLNLDKNIHFLKPFSFTDYLKLQMNAICTISDSGTISEESAILNFPAVTVRNAMERPEALDAGSIILTGINSKIILDAIELEILAKDQDKRKTIPVDYEISNTSLRVVKLILGTCNLSNTWAGIVKN